MNLYNRRISTFPLSIATSLALESIFTGPNPAYDPQRKAPQVVNLSLYSEIWINLETLIRNIAGSVDRPTYFECSSHDVAEVLKSEIEIIRSIFQQEGHGICQPVFYVCSYKSIRAQWGTRVKFRESTTDIQRSYDLKEQQALRRVVHANVDIKELDTDIRPLDRHHAAMIITHLPVDLLSYEHFRQLDLLESHTGVLKPRVQWNTKYAALGKEPMIHLPFFKNLLGIFGDRNQVQPTFAKHRQLVYDISIREKWTPFTKLDKIKQSYRNANLHPADLDFLLSL